MLPVYCDYCGALIDKPLQWIQRQREHHFCNRGCYHKWSAEHRKRRIKRLCLMCGGKFETIKGHIRGPNQGNFCSLKCWGSWHSIQANPFMGRHHTKESKRLIGLKSKERKAWLSLFTKEAREKHQQAIHKPEYRDLMARLVAERNARILIPTKVELKLEELLNKHFPNDWEYTGDGKLIINNMIPDFANKNGKKALLELYGDYWHSESKTKGKWRKTELGRIMAFNSLGFRCLVIWECELKDEQAVVAKVKQFMKRRY